MINIPSFNTFYKLCIKKQRLSYQRQLQLSILLSILIIVRGLNLYNDLSAFIRLYNL